MSKPDLNDLHRAGKLPASPDIGAKPLHPLAPGGALDADPANEVRPKADPFPLVYAPDLAKPIEPLVWLCKSLSMIQGRVLVFTGYGDAGKTFAGMDLELAVASGASQAWGALGIGLAGAVVHLDFEQQEWVTRWRFQRLAYGRGLDLGGLGDRLGLVSLPPMYLTDRRAETELVRLLTGKALAIVDNLTAGCPGIDQNTTAAATVLYMLGRVSAQTGCTIIVVHHDNKHDDTKPGRPRAQRMRGSGAIHAAVGGGVAFTNEDGVIKYEQIKETMGPKPEPGFFRFVDVGEVDQNTGRTVGLRLEWTPTEEAAEMRADAAGKAKEAVRAYLRTHGPCPKGDVRKNAKGAAKAAIGKALDAMIDDGEVETVERERGAVFCSLRADAE